MDKKTIIGFLLIFGILMGWSYFTKPSKEELAQQKHIEDSVKTVRQQEALQKAIELKQSESAKQITSPESAADNNQSLIADQYGDFASSAYGEKKYYTVENDLMKLTFSNLGGRIYSVELKKYKTYDGKPLILFNGDSTIFGLNFFASNRSIATNNLFFNTEAVENSIISNDTESISFKLAIDSTNYIEYLYTISKDKYLIDFNINFNGVNNTIASNMGYLTLEWQSYINSFEKGKKWELQNSSIFYKYDSDESAESLSMRSNNASENLTTKVKWISYKQQFFNTTLIAKNAFANADINSTSEVINPNHLKHFTSKISIPYTGKDQESIPMQFYFGPNHYKTLKKLDLGMENLVELGRNIIRWVNVGLVIPMFNFLGKHMNNYGLIILIMTIVIKIIIFPFTYKSYMSTAKMKALKPEVDKVTEKFNKPEDAMKKQQETMKLYKKVGVNPMGGCLPLLFQMPILIAMFRFFPNSIELRQKSFLWAEDLSTYDAVINLPFTVPFGFGDHISLFCLLMTIVNIIYMKTNDQMSAAGTQQMPGMKFMMYMMPIMMLFWFNSYASGLSYYYFVSLLITMGQTWAIRKTINDEEILAKLKAAQASKKPVKKSKWAQRMEEMAKQRGIKPPKR